MKWNKSSSLGGLIHWRLLRLDRFNLYDREVDEIGHVGSNGNKDVLEFTVCA